MPRELLETVFQFSLYLQRLHRIPMRDKLSSMTSTKKNDFDAPPLVEVIIEIPRGSFLKRGSDGNIDFVSPLPCPYNYGSVHQYIGGEGDFLDAMVLGPRLPVGTRLQVNAYGAVGLSERYMSDDKLICADHPITVTDRRLILTFFRVYALCKGMLNVLRGQKGRSSCDGWGDASAAISRATPVGLPSVAQVPKIGF